MQDALDRAAHTARELERRIGVDHHDVLVMLGSGLSGVGELLGRDAPSLPLDTLPFFPPYTAVGHRAHGWSVAMGDHRVLVVGGRAHLYEGIGPAEAVHPVRMGTAAGCTTVILTAAAGAVRAGLSAGELMVVADHLNLTGRSPLSGPAFVDLAGAYNAELCRVALSTPGVTMAERPGVYAQVVGPQFETPAEVDMLRALGADAVGMSMALETIAARHAQATVLGVALITNTAGTAAGSSELEAIAAVGAAAADNVAVLVHHVVGSLP